MNTNKMKYIFNLKMGLVFVLTLLLFKQSTLYAQTPNTGIFFQAIARDQFANPAKDRKIYVQSSIIQSTATGTKVLIEEHQTMTDGSGVFSISVGQGTRTGGTVANLDNVEWARGPYFLNLKISINPLAPVANWDYTKDWIDLGTSPFGTVPYALYSGSTGALDSKLNIADTVKMLSIYAKAVNVNELANQVKTKLSVEDTTTMLAPYAKMVNELIATNITSLTAETINAALDGKVNLADSITQYVTPTQLNAKTFDSTAIYNQIGLRATTASVTTSLATKEDVANKSTSVTTDAASDTKFPSVKAVKTYVDTEIAGATIPDANTTAKGKIQLAGDLAGTAAAPLIATDAVTTAKIKDANVTDAKIVTVSGSKVVGDIAGNAATASKIATPVTINGVSFDGSSNITIASAAANTLTMNTSGAGEASGATFDGSAAKTISYNTIGASPLEGSSSLTTLGTITTGVWSGTTIDVANGGTGQTTLSGVKSILGLNGTNIGFAADAGITNQGSNAIAIGSEAGKVDQGNNSISIGAGAGKNAQALGAIGIGYVSGYDAQGVNAISIGSNSAQSNQSNQAVAIGYAAGQYNQGANAVAIGSFAGNNGQLANSIAINGTGNSLNPANSGLFIDPVRNLTATNTLFYNPTTKEITYGLGDGVNTIGDIGVTSNSKGVTLSGTTISLTPADDINGGVVTTGTQTFSGSKAFLNQITSPSINLSNGTLSGAGASNWVLGTSTGSSSLSLYQGGCCGRLTIDDNGRFAIGANYAPTTYQFDVQGNGRFTQDLTANSFIGPLTGNATTATTAGNITATSNTTLTSLLNLTEVGTITTGVWSGTAIAIANGGTGATTASDALTNLGAESIANRSNDIDLGGTGASNSKYPSQLAVKTYVSNQFASGGVADNSITNSKLFGGITASKLVGTDISTVGTINTGIWNGSTLGIAYGGTNATTAAAALTNLGGEPTSNKSDNTSLGTSTSLFPTQNAVKSYVDTKVAAVVAPDATTTTNGILRLAGDLGNTATSPSVVSVGGSTAAAINTATNAANAATDANTINTIVKRNSAGDFSAGTITANLVGNVTGNVSGTAASVTGIVTGAKGGTGVDNGSKTLTIGGDFVTAGTGSLSLTYSGTTNVTLPATGTLATLSGSENLNNKTINGLTLNTLSTGFSINGGTISKTLTISDDATLSGTNTGDQTIVLSGDLSGSGTGVISATLSNTGVTAGTYGSATTVPNFTVDEKGRITNVTNTTITGVSPIGSALSGGKLYVGDAAGSAQPVTITGDFTINNLGVGTLSANSVTNTNLAGGIDLASKVTGTLPVANGGTGATSLTGYLKGDGTNAFTSVTSIPVADVTGAVVKVNGVQPDGNGNVTVPTVAVMTGTYSEFTTIQSGTYTGTAGTTFVVSNDISSNNGRTFIFQGTSNVWYEITTNQAATDARYLIKSGDVMTGALTVPSLTINTTPSASSDATTKAYVDNLVTNATLSATTSATGKIQLAGDLGGSATSPTVVSVGGATASAIASATTLANAATASNTTNSIVIRDVSGNFSAGTITANIIGNVTGNVSGNAANVTGIVAVANGGSGASTLTGYLKGNGTNAYTANALIPVADVTNAEDNRNKSIVTDLGGVNASDTKYPTQLAVKSYVDTKVAAATIPDADASTKGKIQLTGDLGNTAASPTVVSVGGSTAADINTATTAANAATATNTFSTIVKRDASGNFSAGTITANLTGTASKATILATARTIATTGDVNYTSGSFDGSANVTGIATLVNSGVVSGTYGSSTAIPSLTIDSKGRITNATNTSIIAGVNTVGTIAASASIGGATISGTTIILTPADGTNGGIVSTGAQTFAGTKTFNSTITGSISGNAGTATALAVGRTIGITGDLTYTSPSFDGSGNITAAGTLANSGVASGTYGSSTAIPILTVDSKGRITNASTTSIIAGVNTVGSISASSNAAGATVSGTTITLTPADASNGGVVTTGAQSFAGVKTFTNNTASTTPSTGAVIVTGGLGVGGAINVGGAATFSSTVKITTGAGDSKFLISDASGNATWSYAAGATSTKTGAYTITLADKYVFFGSTASAAATFTLPLANGNAGKEIIIKNKSAYLLTVQRAGSTETIFQDNANAGVTSITLGIEASNNWVKLVSDGTQWVVFRALF